ncbi:MAG: LptF/LptG family permease [Bacteroidales bacterium]|nr:LptF/LptG family permease [Bacteroidales bacterium]
MKKLDKLILKSYLGPLVLTFSISMFVLILEFLWRKVETLIGKGLDFTVFLKLFAYAGASLIPLALPLSVLLASIMTMGNFAEKSELTAMKSAGLPLWRVFRPLIILSLVLSAVAFYSASFVIPNAELKVKQILVDIRDTKPAINIRPNEFFTDISSYVIRVDKKEASSNKLYGIIIYDHSKNQGNVEVIKADSGYMYSVEKEQTLVFELYNGEVFSEDLSAGNMHTRPLTRIDFEKQTIRFDVSDFAFEEKDADRYSDGYKVINVLRLSRRIDTLENELAQRKQKYFSNLYSQLNIVLPESENTKQQTVKYDFYNDCAKMGSAFNKRTDSFCRSTIYDMNESYQTNMMIIDNDELYLTRHRIEFYRKFTLSLACIILFFIGAPLGAIIRKGGLGLPVVVSLLAFVIYYVIGTMGESAAKSGTLAPLIATWLSSIVFFPFGIFLTLKATSDSKLFSSENWYRLFAKLSLRRKNNKQ